MTRTRAATWAVIGLLVVTVFSVAIARAGKSAPVAEGSAAVTTTSSPTTAAPIAPAPMSSPPTVSYYCDGSAPDGVDITYGAEGSTTDDSSATLPFSQSGPLDTSAQYVVTTAQLSGSGNVTCTTTVNDGAQHVADTQRASGGYALLNAEICDFNGKWSTC